MRESGSPYVRVPAVVKTLFDAFPLKLYPAAPLPNTTAGATSDNRMATVFVESASETSIYPESIRLITLLKMAKVYQNVSVVEASVHSAPETESLPYIYRAKQHKLGMKLPRAIPSDGPVFLSFLSAVSSSGVATYNEARDAPYLALVDVDLRHAFLFTVYHIPENYRRFVVPMHAALSGKVLAETLASSARKKAREVLEKSIGTTDVMNPAVQESIYDSAESALDALQDLLTESDGMYLSGTDTPGVVDAALFSYLWPSLQLGFTDQGNPARLYDMVQGRKLLVEYVESIRRSCNL
ncbi:uncharacterized protein V1518DRAFT_413318 [Limtongia smithiae]|uniref:uncharacterized protein n=1 Tax=Limtongia smithiae TaxID=1125753 RepID=UPI0034CFF196